MPNYLGLPSNCMTVSGFYAMCCVDECSGLLSKLETAIGSPTADPGRITDVIAAINSSTVSAPRELSVVLMKRLSEIANRNAGLVPLHGHLFAQWMHHAYPRECTYPHKAGTTNPMSADEWMDEKGIDAVVASEAEMAHHVTDPPTGHMSGLSQDRGKSLMWSAEEELIVSATAPPGRSSSILSCGTRLMALLSLCVGVLRTLWPTIVSTLNRENLLPMSHKAHYC